MINPSKELQAAMEAATIGGKLALKYFQTNLEIKTKNDNSILTVADVEVEETIKQHITNFFPDAEFLAEESGGNMHAEDFWIIDPIDGTRVFAKGIPQWSILIAHYRNQEITTGICYNPTQKLMLVAEKGKGAYLNGKKITVSNRKETKQSFGSFGSIQRFKTIDPILKLKNAGVVLRSYEHAYSLTFLASGQMDVVIDAYGTPWDYGPFIRIIPEAGGKITDLKGKDWDFETEAIIATNGILHDELLKVISG